LWPENNSDEGISISFVFFEVIVSAKQIVFNALTLLVGRQEERLTCNKLSDEALVWLSVWSEQTICMWSSCCYCHPVVSCFIKIQNGFTFLVPAYPGRPGKEAVRRLSVGLVSASLPSFML